MNLTRDEELAIKFLRGKCSLEDIKEYQEIIKLKELDGNNLILTCSQVVEQLKPQVPNLTTTFFNEWLSEVMNMGTYWKIGKRRVFQPNEKYEEFVCRKGLAVTGKTLVMQKTTAYYTQSMVTRIRQHHLQSLNKYVESKNSRR